MGKKKILFILHYSPPVHGASKVGDTIKHSQIINTSLNARYIKIKSSNSINEIGKFKVFKVFYFLDLFFKVCYYLIFFRPKIIYYTTSPSGFAFYRDFIVSLPIKLYKKIVKCNTFYDYHSKGINTFVSNSSLSKKLANYFLKEVNIILISKQMETELANIRGFSKVFILKNGVEDMLSQKEFKQTLALRNQQSKLNVLYLSNLMKEKGYDTALELAKKLVAIDFTNFNMHFAGNWSSKDDEVFFKDYVKNNKLQRHIVHHGLVMGKEKDTLFKSANLFIFPSRYKKEVFPLSVLEALSYGLPVLAFRAGAVSEIVTSEIGIITNEKSFLDSFLGITNKNYLNNLKYEKCRNIYLDNYTLKVFETNLLKILKSD